MRSDGNIEQVSTRGRPIGDREAKRKALLRAASSVIADEGYANASLRKVARHAGYTTGAVTYYFANKEELLAQGRHEPAFAEVIARRYARYRRILASLVKDAQERGAIRNDIPADILTDQLVAMGDGWMMMYPIEPRRFTPKRMRALIDALAVLVAPVPGEQRDSGARSKRA